MAKRARKGGGKGGMTTWWAVAALVVGAVALAWWLSARRAEAPGLPASQPGARALSESPEAQADRADHDDHGHGEVTGEEKAALDRIIREGSAPKPDK